MVAPKILVVDDDKNLLELAKTRLAAANYGVTVALGQEEALEAVNNESFDLAIVDLRLADEDGITLMEKLHAIFPGMPVIILTGHASVEGAVDAMKRGAYTYLTKPFDPRELILQIGRALESCKLASENQMLKGMLKEKYDFANIVAKSDKMQRVLEAVSRIAKTDSTVYIHGESGTGKELIAKAIHLASPRKDKPFVAINCAAIPETLLESELFGHEKGAFTGAVRSTKGLFTQANEGTLFLDEIGDMPLSIQVKLLRALEERQFYPVGGEKPVQVDVRVVVATKKDLVEEVKKGQFREDLFYRIHVIPIVLPTLKDRIEDIPYLVDHLLKKISQQMKRDRQRPYAQGNGKVDATRLAGQRARIGKYSRICRDHDPARYCDRRSRSANQSFHGRGGGDGGFDPSATFTDERILQDLEGSPIRVRKSLSGSPAAFVQRQSDARRGDRRKISRRLL